MKSFTLLLALVCIGLGIGVTSISSAQITPTPTPTPSPTPFSLDNVTVNFTRSDQVHFNVRNGEASIARNINGYTIRLHFPNRDAHQKAFAASSNLSIPLGFLSKVWMDLASHKPIISSLPLQRMMNQAVWAFCGNEYVRGYYNGFLVGISDSAPRGLRYTPSLDSLGDGAEEMGGGGNTSEGAEKVSVEVKEDVGNDCDTFAVGGCGTACANVSKWTYSDKSVTFELDPGECFAFARSWAVDFCYCLPKSITGRGPLLPGRYTRDDGTGFDWPPR